MWIDPQAHWLVLDAASQAKADAVVSLLVEHVPGLAVALLDTALGAQAAMAQWLMTADFHADDTIVAIFVNGTKVGMPVGGGFTQVPPGSSVYYAAQPVRFESGLARRTPMSQTLAEDRLGVQHRRGTYRRTDRQSDSDGDQRPDCDQYEQHPTVSETAHRC